MRAPMRRLLPVLVASSLACRSSSRSDARREPTSDASARAEAEAEARPKPPDVRVPDPVVYLGDELALVLPSAAIDPAKDGFELVDPGAEPRSTLRFSPEPGAAIDFELTMQIRMSVEGTLTPRVAQLMPKIHQYSRSKVASVTQAEGGGLRIEHELILDRFVVDGSAEDPMVELTAKATLILDERGALVEGEPSLLPDTSKQLRRSLEHLNRSFAQILIRLPEQAVGLGARWRETSEHASSSIELEQTSELEIVSLGPAGAGGQPGIVTVGITLTRRPKTTALELPDLPEATAELLEFDSRGAGTAVWDLGELLPRHAEICVDTAFTIEASAGGQSQQTKTDVSVALVLDRVAKPDRE